MIIWYRRTADGTEEALEIDVVISESYSGSAEATEHPVEAGARKSDHVIARPPEIRIEGLVSNARIAPEPGIVYDEQRHEFTGGGEESEDRVETARTVLESIRVSGEPVNLELGTLDRQTDGMGTRYSGRGLARPTWRFFEGYALTSLDMPRDKGTGDALRFSATFKAITTAESQVVAAPVVTETRAKPRQNAGQQNATKASDPDAAAASSKNESVLHAMFGD